MAGGFAEFGVLPDPADVGSQCLGEPVGAGLEYGRVIKENEVQPPQRLGHHAVFDAPADNRREALVEGGRVRNLLERNIGGDRVGREHEDDSVGVPDQRFDALPPILEGINFAVVDQRLKAARLKRRLKPIGESHVLARVGDEDSGLRPRLVR